MALNIKRFIQGIQLVPVGTTAVTLGGELEFLSSSNKLNLHNGSSVSPVVTEAHTATLTNKSLSDTTVNVVNASTASKQLGWDLSGATASTKMTLISSQTVNRSLTLPDATDVLVARATTDTLTNKTMSGLSNTFSNIADGSLSTSYIKADGTRALTANWAAGAFSGTFNSVIVGSAANTINGLSTIVNTGTLTLPTSTDTLVGRATSDTLTNKILSGNTAATLISGAGTFTLNTSGTITVPSTTDTLVGKATTDTLTNKTLAAPVLSTFLDFTDNAAPANPSAGTHRGYVSSVDGKLHIRDSTGVDVAVGSGAGSINYFSSNSDIEAGTTGYSVAADGDTTTITNASPAVFTAANTHGMVVGQQLYLTTTGGLPTGLSVGTLYYVSNVPSSTTFRVSASLGGADVNTSSAGSGVHTFRPSIPITGGRAFIAATATIAASSSTALRGAKNLLFTPGNVGDYVLYTITPDSADTAKMLTFSVDYTITTPASYVDGDIQLYLYDVGNSQIIQPTPYKILGTSKPGTFTCQFQTPGANLSTIRVILVQNTTNSAYGSVRFDNFQCAPVSRVYGAPVSDWVTTWTPTGGWNTNTTYTGKWRRVGDSIEIIARVTLSGAPNSTTFSLNLPSGLSMDTTKINSTSAPVDILGSGEVYDGAGTGSKRLLGDVQYVSATAVVVTGMFSPAANTHYPIVVDQANPKTFASGDGLLLHFIAPIAGWSSNVLMSTDVDNRVCAARAVLTTAQTAVTSKIIPFNSITYDTHGAMNTTGRFTCPLPGYYRVNAHALLGSLDGATDCSLQVFKNGAAYTNQTYGARLTGGATTTMTGAVSELVQCIAGDFIEIQVNGDASFDIDSNGLRTGWTVERLTGPSAIAASETIAASTYRSGNQTGVNPNNSAVKMQLNSVAATTGHGYDTHGGMDTVTNFRYTAQASGKYRCSGTINVQNTNVLANAYQAVLYINGVAAAYGPYVNISAITQAFTVGVSSTLKLNGGDYVELFLFGAGNNSASTLTVAGGSNATYLDIERIGL